MPPPKYPSHIDPTKKPPNTRYDDRGRGRWLYRDREAKKEHRIGNSATTLAELWNSVDALQAGGVKTFKTLSLKFQQSEEWAGLAESTRRDYLLCHKAICGKKTRAGSKLGDVPLSAWTIGAVRRYRDERKKTTKSRAKKEIAYIKRLFAWAVEYEHMQTNVAAAVSTKGLASVSKEYIGDRDYETFLYLAPLRLALMAHMAYLTGRRRPDILSIRVAHVEREGLFFAESKTDKAAIVCWSPPDDPNPPPREQTELYQLVQLCIEEAGGSPWLFPKGDDPREHYSLSALSSAWGDTMREIVGNPPSEGFTRFTFKNLRAKHASDLEERGGDATDNLLHSDRGLTERHYLRKRKKVVSLR